MTERVTDEVAHLTNVQEVLQSAIQVRADAAIAKVNAEKAKKAPGADMDLSGAESDAGEWGDQERLRATLLRILKALHPEFFLGQPWSIWRT